MRISWNWLKQYFDSDISPDKAAEILTSTGLEVESVELHEPIKGMLQGVVVGHVLSCGKHPDADRLSVCMVELGTGEPVQIVCGAPNVAVGQKVLVATVGANLCMKDNTCIVIKKSKIRGQESNGMICAEDELGLGNDHDGILVLDPSSIIGTSAVDQLGLKSDHVLEIGLTPNRTDAMGHIGVARDLVAALVHRTGADVKLKWPDVDQSKSLVDGKSVTVEVLVPDACPRYAGVTLTDVKVGPSPEWLQKALTSIGLKPVNNVVDATNYVQHELGQPLHAFDADVLANDRIIVRKATKDEKFVALDGVERKMNEQDLVIADAHEPACIAGIYGGEKSGVTERTVRVFLESAFFDPTTIRRTARRHGLNTDASYRFERGVDPDLTVFALQRAMLLLKEVAGAKPSSVITDIDARKNDERVIDLRFDAVDLLTGINIPHDQIIGILELLDFGIVERNSDHVKLKAPSYRMDVTRPADVIEEILRIHGFDQVPVPERLLFSPINQEAFTLERYREVSGQHLATRGFKEIMTPSLVNGERAQHELLEERSLIRMANPLSAELDVLRPSMVAGALQAVAYNINRQQRDLRFFERGRVYSNDGKKITEPETLSVTMTGERWRDRWRSEKRKAELADVKEEVESLMERMGVNAQVSWSACEHPFLINAHHIRVDRKDVGVIGEISREKAGTFDVSQPVFYAELNEGVLVSICKKEEIGFMELSKFPSVRRDLSLLLNDDVKFDVLKKAVFQAERKILRAVDLFDVYEGDKLPKGKKSYAVSMVFQDPEGTLTDAVVEKAMGRIRSALEKEVGAELRG